MPEYAARKIGQTTHHLNKPTPLEARASIYWWNPSRLGVMPAPSHFLKQLEEIDPKLSACWNADTERWQIWTKNDRVKHYLCPGWMLLFIVEDAAHRYQPLDERVFHRLYQASQRVWGSAKRYFDAVEREMVLSKELEDKRYKNDRDAEAVDWYNHSQISVGYGKSNGSKFSKYLA